MSKTAVCSCKKRPIEMKCRQGEMKLQSSLVHGNN